MLRQESSNDVSTILDSGASRHFCSIKSRFTSYVQNDEHDTLDLGHIRYANCKKGAILGYGKVGHFNNVLHTPTLDADVVLSVGLLTADGFIVTFEKNGAKVTNSRGNLNLIMNAYRTRTNTYIVSTYHAGIVDWYTDEQYATYSKYIVTFTITTLASNYPKVIPNYHVWSDSEEERTLNEFVKSVFGSSTSSSDSPSTRTPATNDV